MADGLSWSKLTSREKYDYGVFVIVSALCAVIMYQNHKIDTTQESVNVKIREAVQDQKLQTDLWKGDSKFWQNKCLRILEKNAIKDSVWEAKFNELKK